MFIVKTIIGVRLPQLPNIFNIRIVSQTIQKRENLYCKSNYNTLYIYIYINTFVFRKIHYLGVPQNINRKGTSVYVYTYMYIVSSRHVTFDLVSQRRREKGLRVTDVPSSLWVHLIRPDRVHRPYFLGSPLARFIWHRFISRFFFRKFVNMPLPNDTASFMRRVIKCQ